MIQNFWRSICSINAFFSFALGTYAQREHLRHTHSPPPPKYVPMSYDGACPHVSEANVLSYDGYCSFCVNELKRALLLFPEDTWLHDILDHIEGQIPADHINGHGPDCQKLWQAIYASCRAHFHGESAEVIWAFLNPLGSSTRQMTAGARHDIINFVMDSWNTSKVRRQGEFTFSELGIGTISNILQPNFWQMNV